MYEEEINFRNSYLYGFGRFDPSDLDLWPHIRVKLVNAKETGPVSRVILIVVLHKYFVMFDHIKNKVIKLLVAYL